MPNPTVALSMLVKGSEGKRLDRCLASISPFVDKIYLTVTQEGDEAIKVGKKYDADIDDTHRFDFNFQKDKKKIAWFEKRLGWTPLMAEMNDDDRIINFGMARQYSFERVDPKYDWILWIDADDIFRGGEKIKDILADAEKHDVQGIFLNYLYQVQADDEGRIKNVLIEHQRERFVRNGYYKWVAPIHETLVPVRGVRQIDVKQMDVVHLSDDKRASGNFRRNTLTLEFNIFDTDMKDPRPIYYLGKVHFDNVALFNKEDSLQKALNLFDIYINGSEEHNFNNKSGWAEERAQCYEFMSELYRRAGAFNNAIKAAVNGLIESPQTPSLYLSLALTYLTMQDWAKAKHWLGMSLNCPKAVTTLAVTPRDLQARAHEVAYHVALSEQNVEVALESARALLDLKPEDKGVIEKFNYVVNAKNVVEATKRVIGLAKYLEKIGEGEKLKPLLSAVPHTLMNSPIIGELTRKVIPPRTWGEDEICIYCGPAFAPWSPKLMENPTEHSFLGGSEEAVVYLGQELRKLGWKVTVYADPQDDEGDHDGVKYLPYYKFNREDNFNIMVGWRRPDFVDGNYKNKKIYIWCHDILNQLDFTQERLDKIDKVIVLSPWHRENIPNVPDEKIMVSSNGIPL